MPCPGGHGRSPVPCSKVTKSPRSTAKGRWSMDVASPTLRNPPHLFDAHNGVGGRLQAFATDSTNFSAITSSSSPDLHEGILDVGMQTDGLVGRQSPGWSSRSGRRRSSSAGNVSPPNRLLKTAGGLTSELHRGRRVVVVFERLAKAV